MVELYDALCFKEPWLELMLLGLKGLETRTKLMRKRSGDVVFCSSKEVDTVAWNNAVGGLLDAAAKERALAGLGKMRGIMHMDGFRSGVPYSDDDRRALITIALPNGKNRFVSEVTNSRRIVEVPTMRYRDGVNIPGASQGFFKVSSDLVRLLA